jgi:hypothetical protein
MIQIFEFGQHIDIGEKFIRRFWSKVDRNGPIPRHRPELGQCWVWTRATSGSGYGRVQLPRRYGLGDPCRCAQAHRVAWQLEGNAPPGALWVLHRCDNPPCVNPGHLFLGTQADNVADMHAKGRASGGSVPRPGESNPNAKVTEEDVAAIRVARAGGVTCRQLGLTYGLSPGQICRIGTGTRWRQQPLRASTYGHPLIELPADQVQSLGKVAWPRIEGAA